MTTRRLNLRRCDTHFPHRAREFVRAALTAEGLEEIAETIDLLVSELVTYALVGGEFDQAAVDVTIVGDLVRVEVTDPSSYLAAVMDDLPLEHTLRSGGIGLFMVDQVARRWGVDAAGEGSMVWFEVDVESARRTQLERAGTPERAG